MMSFTLQYRTGPSNQPYFCHVCSSTRTNEQILTTESGDLKCSICKQTGFVEKVNSGGFDDLNSFYSRRSNRTSSQSRRSSQYDPFSNIFGVPLSTFFENMFSGSLAFPMTSTDPNVPMELRFAQDFSNFFNQPFTTMSQPGTSTQVPLEGFFQNDDLSRMFLSFASNPFNEQAMNQILQYIMENDPNRYGPPPAAKKVVDSLKVEVLTSETAKKLEVCAVCTEEFKEGDKIHWLTERKELCGHPFHVDCIIPWLKERNSCPVCRFELPTDDEEYNKQRENLRNRIAEEVQRNMSSRSNQTNNNTNNL